MLQLRVLIFVDNKMKIQTPMESNLLICKPSKDYDMPGSTDVEDIREIKEILSEILKEKLLPGQQTGHTEKVSEDDDKNRDTISSYYKDKVLIWHNITISYNDD